METLLVTGFKFGMLGMLIVIVAMLYIDHVTFVDSPTCVNRHLYGRHAIRHCYEHEQIALQPYNPQTWVYLITELVFEWLDLTIFKWLLCCHGVFVLHQGYTYYKQTIDGTPSKLKLIA